MKTLLLSPTTLVKSPPALLFWPPLTDASPPLAVFFRPPLTLASSPLATLSTPPLTLAWRPLATLKSPPLTARLFAAGGVVGTAANTRLGAHKHVAGHIHWVGVGVGTCDVALPTADTRLETAGGVVHPAADRGIIAAGRVIPATANTRPEAQKHVAGHPVWVGTCGVFQPAADRGI